MPEEESSPCLNTTAFGGTSTVSAASSNSSRLSSSSRHAKNLVDAKKSGVESEPNPEPEPEPSPPRARSEGSEDSSFSSLSSFASREVAENDRREARSADRRGSLVASSPARADADARVRSASEDVPDPEPEASESPELPALSRRGAGRADAPEPRSVSSSSAASSRSSAASALASSRRLVRASGASSAASRARRYATTAAYATVAPAPTASARRARRDRGAMPRTESLFRVRVTFSDVGCAASGVGEPRVAFPVPPPRGASRPPSACVVSKPTRAAREGPPLPTCAAAGRNAPLGPQAVRNLECRKCE